MAHALDDEYYNGALAVLADEVIAQDQAMDVMMIIAAVRGEMLRRIGKEMDRQRQPTRMEEYVEHTIAMYNDRVQIPLQNGRGKF